MKNLIFLVGKVGFLRRIEKACVGSGYGGSGNAIYWMGLDP